VTTQPSLGLRRHLADWAGALAERDFRMLFLARSSSLVGDYVAQIAVAFAVLERSGSSGDLGLVLAARTAPLVLLTAAGGVWADRLPRQRVMMGADLLCCAAQAALAVLVISGGAEIWHFVVLQALVGTGLAFFRPAATGVTPGTVSPARLQQANGLLFLSQNVMFVVGPALGGVLVAGVGTGTAIAVDAGTFAASAAFLALVRAPLGLREGARESFRHELAAGWREVTSRRWLWTGILDYAAFQLVVLGTFFVLGPTIAQRDLGGAGAWAAVISATGVGAIAGAVVSLRWRPARPLAVCFGLLVAWGAPLLALGLGAPTALVAAAGVPAGFALSLSGTLWETTLQRQIPEQSLSRVSAYDWMGSTTLRPLGYVVVGPIAAAIGLHATLIAATVALVAATAATLAVPDMRRRA
jgi:MFS family permease